MFIIVFERGRGRGKWSIPGYRGRLIIKSWVCLLVGVWGGEMDIFGGSASSRS